jgi:hypothetical protein
MRSAAGHPGVSPHETGDHGHSQHPLTPFPETGILRSMAKTNQERLQALREKREKMGLKRFDVYLHPSEWSLVKRYIDRLAKRRNAK